MNDLHVLLLYFKISTVSRLGAIRSHVPCSYHALYIKHSQILRCVFLLSGFLTGGHVIRLFHGHMDECLAIATPEEGEEKRR